MPIIKSAKKRVKQAAKTQERKREFKTRMLTMIKNIVKFVQLGEVEKAQSFHAEAQKSIDTAAKKNIIHKNNANRKKARIARVIASADAQA